MRAFDLDHPQAANAYRRAELREALAGDCLVFETGTRGARPSELGCGFAALRTVRVSSRGLVELVPPKPDQRHFP